MKKNAQPSYNDVNRTGALMAPERTKELMNGVAKFSPQPDLSQMEAREIRTTIINEGALIGSLPETTDPKATDPIFIDKLGARLAFERSGVRLYEMLMLKRAAVSDDDTEPTSEDLEHIRDEELEHFHLLQRSIVQLGGDPTSVTPAADVEGVVSSGLFQIVADPRTTLSQCLDAALAAELIDNDCWHVLATLARSKGLNDLASEFDDAFDEEQEHLENVRSWIRTGLNIEAA